MGESRVYNTVLLYTVYWWHVLFTRCVQHRRDYKHSLHLFEFSMCETSKQKAVLDSFDNVEAKSFLVNLGMVRRQTFFNKVRNTETTTTKTLCKWSFNLPSKLTYKKFWLLYTYSFQMIYQKWKIQYKYNFQEVILECFYRSKSNMIIV